MLIINTPTDNLIERKYIIHIIFNEFLDIEYCHKTGSSNWDITLDNNHKLIIEDHFFSKNKNDLDYLTPDSLPAENQILMLSGRIGYELIQKAALAGIPVIAGLGAPSTMAVDAAREGGLTLIGFLRSNRFNVHTGAWRLIDE